MACLTEPRTMALTFPKHFPEKQKVAEESLPSGRALFVAGDVLAEVTDQQT